jgi:hypothetical protein
MNIDDFNKEELVEMQSLLFSSEINLLSVHILLEAFYRGENILTLEDFIKGDYWKIDEIYEAVRENGDYGSAEDLVLEQIILTIALFGLGKVKKISVTALSSFLDEVVEEAVKSKAKDNELEEAVAYYSAVVSKICELKALSDKRREEVFEKDPDMGKWREYYNRIDFEPSEHSKYLEYIISAGAPFIEIDIEFAKDGATKLEEALKDYLSSFSQDDFLEERENRLYFSKQLENFLVYINKLPLINGCINVPFEVLSEKGFEFIKIVSYLENQKKLKVRNWGDKSLWNIKFNHTPITINSLVSNAEITEIKKESKNLKANLSFDEAKSILEIGNNIVRLRKGSDQFHLLRIIFEDKNELPKEWFYSEIAEKYDMGATFDDKKFYNASYQVNQKIARDTPFKDALITTSQSVRINPKYLA